MTQADAPAGGPLVFVSYAREDRELCRRLVLMLGLVLKPRGYGVWWDQVMVAGAWRNQLDEHLERAAAGVLLVSEHALASHFIQKEELPKLLANGPVAPVYGSPCPWQSDAVIAALQFLGSTDKALAELDESRGELAAALNVLAREAPDFLQLPPILAKAEEAGTARDEDGAPPFDPADVIGRSEQPGMLHGVPELPDGYFERATDIEELRAHLLAGAGSTVYGVHGGGGIGKTVLASALARDPEVRRAFPDGVYWAVLGERPDVVTTQAALARLAGLDAIFRTVEEGLAALREAFDGRRVLVVIDDAWSAADVEALMVTGVGGRLLITTRHPLVLDRVRADGIPVQRLSGPEARRFLAHATRRREPLPPEADALIEAVGGVVLALALVGATILHGTSWADALADVRAAGDIYTAESFANQFKAMALAWGALDADARERYGELAVFGEDVAVPIRTVARLWRRSAGFDEAASRNLVTELAERSLFGYDGAIRFHDLQRAFLQLQTVDSARAHQRLLAAHTDVPLVPGAWGTLPDDEPYLWDHLVDHLIGAGDARPLEAVLVDPVWLVHRYHLQGPHAPESDLLRGLAALPTYRLGAQVLHRLRQISHVVGAVTTLADRALTLAHHLSDLVDVDALTELLPPIRVSPRRSLSAGSDALERVVTGHADGVWSAAWSPDGRQIASAGLDGTVRVFDTDAAGQTAATLRGHAGAVRAVAWSSDGRRLASAGDDGSVRVVAATDWERPALELPGHDGAVWSVAWSPDGERLASAGSDGTIGIWEPGSEDAAIAVLTGHAGSVWSVAWSPDGSRIVSGGGDGTVRAWTLDAPNGAPQLLGEHDGWAWSVAWSPDGSRIASGGGRTVSVWDPGAPGASAGDPYDHDGSVWSVAWSPDGRRLASSSTDRTVRLWDPAGAEDPAVLAGHDDHVWSVAWSPDGRRLVSAGHDETVRIWDPSAAAPLELDAESPGRWVWSVAWTRDGRRVVSGAEDGALRVWNAGSPDAGPAALATLDGGIWAVACSPDGARLAVGGADRVIRLWDAPFRGTPSLTLTGHRGLLRSLAWSPDGCRLASAADDGTLRIWRLLEAAQPSPVVLADPDAMRARSVSWSPDGGWLASGHDDGTVRMRAVDVEDEPAIVAKGHTGRVEMVAWSPDGQRLTSAGLDGTVRLWDAADGLYCAAVLTGHGDPVTAVAWAPGGEWPISGGEDGTVRLWDGESGAPVCALGLGSMVCSLACSGDRIAVGTTATVTVLAVDAAVGARA
jgi:WD40 repeat protein